MLLHTMMMMLLLLLMLMMILQEMNQPMVPVPSSSSSSRWSMKMPSFILMAEASSTTGKKKKETNLYKILGVSRTATSKEIKTAYRKKALNTHPDKRKDIPPEQAAEEFHQVVHAFEILSDESSRKSYDRTGRSPHQQGQAGSGGGGGSGGNNHWGGGGGGGGGGGFQFHWNYGGHRYQRRKLKDMFKVQEASTYCVLCIVYCDKQRNKTKSKSKSKSNLSS